jgi:hypothetical protein
LRVSGKKFKRTPLLRWGKLTDNVNGAGTRRKQVVWYPALGTCLGFSYVGERGVEPFTTIAVARDENQHQSGANDGPKSKPSGHTHETKHTLLAGALAIAGGKLLVNAVTGNLGSWYGKCPVIRLHVHCLHYRVYNSAAIALSSTRNLKEREPVPLLLKRLLGVVLSIAFLAYFLGPVFGAPWRARWYELATGIIIYSSVAAWIIGMRMRRKIRRDLGRKATEADLTSIDTWMEVEAAEERNKEKKPLA